MEGMYILANSTSLMSGSKLLCSYQQEGQTEYEFNHANYVNNFFYLRSF